MQQVCGHEREATARPFESVQRVRTVSMFLSRPLWEWRTKPRMIICNPGATVSSVTMVMPFHTCSRTISVTSAVICARSHTLKKGTCGGHGEGEHQSESHRHMMYMMYVMLYVVRGSGHRHTRWDGYPHTQPPKVRSIKEGVDRGEGASGAQPWDNS
jgi:hypothetical protein